MSGSRSSAGRLHQKYSAATIDLNQAWSCCLIVKIKQSMFRAWTCFALSWQSNSRWFWCCDCTVFCSACDIRYRCSYRGARVSIKWPHLEANGNEKRRHDAINVIIPLKAVAAHAGTGSTRTVSDSLPGAQWQLFNSTCFLLRSTAYCTYGGSVCGVPISLEAE